MASKSTSKTSAQAQQVSAEQQGQGNIVIGSGAIGDKITVTSADPSVAEAAITANAAVAGYALQSNNVNTALAFSTIDHITAANTLGAEAASNDAAAAALNAANGFGVSPTGAVVAPTPLSAQTAGSLPIGGSGGGLNNAYLIVGILAGLAGLWYYTRTKKPG